MAQFCKMCGQVTNCTENCKHCIEEDESEEELECCS
jgi:hypothetical protein